MVEVKFNKHSIQCFSSWNDIDKPYLFFLSKNFDRLVQIEKDLEFEILATLQLFNIRWWKPLLALKVAKTNNEQMVGLTALIDFLKPLSEIDITNNLMPKIRCKLKYFYGPSEFLSNISIEEFAFADKAFVLFLKEKKFEALDELVAILYREKDKDANTKNKDYKGDNRLPFNSYQIEFNQKRLNCLSFYIKISVFLFYWGCRNSLVKKYKNVFSSGNENKASSLDLGWIQVIFDLSGEKFGTIEETSNHNMHLVMAFLEKEVIRSKKIKFK